MTPQQLVDVALRAGRGRVELARVKRAQLELEDLAAVSRARVDPV